MTLSQILACEVPNHAALTRGAFPPACAGGFYSEVNMQTGHFAASDVIQCYAPPNLRSVMPGNKVMLRSGGPEMTVCDTNEHGQALCQWMDGDRMVANAFDLECLTCYGAK